MRVALRDDLTKVLRKGGLSPATLTRILHLLDVDLRVFAGGGLPRVDDAIRHTDAMYRARARRDRDVYQKAIALRDALQRHGRWSRDDVVAVGKPGSEEARRTESPWYLDALASITGPDAVVRRFETELTREAHFIRRRPFVIRQEHADVFRSHYQLSSTPADFGADLNALIEECAGSLRFLVSMLKQGPGRKEVFARKWLVHEVAHHFENYNLPVIVSNTSLFANVVRLVLAEADRIERLRPRDRDVIARHLKRWLQGYMSRHDTRIPISKTAT